MAKFSKGILGGFSGQVGNVVGGSWKGIDYMRSKPNNVKDPKTEAQLAQRQKFAMVTSFLKKTKPVVNAGFKTKTKRMTPVNSAMSYNLKNAISGDYPNQQIDFTSIMVARGDLMPGQDANAESNTPNQISFSWVDNSGIGSAHATDKVLLAVIARIKIAQYVLPAKVRNAVKKATR
ncbi:MAG: DUF6266 family protein [Fodinibius sp.]|nr:DUF6266 family protein [Fodinibius sp.]